MFSTLNLQRWGGLSAVAAGVLLAAGALLQDRAGGSAFLPTGHLPVLPLLGSLLLLGGLAELHARQAGVYGRMGTAGFRIAFIGTLVGVVLGAAAVLAGAFVEDRASIAVALFGGVAAGLAHLVVGFGLLVFGIATLRARALTLPWRLLPMAIFLLDVPLRPLVVLLLGADLRRALVLQEGPYAEPLTFLVWDAGRRLLDAAGLRAVGRYEQERGRFAPAKQGTYQFLSRPTPREILPAVRRTTLKPVRPLHVAARPAEGQGGGADQ